MEGGWRGGSIQGDAEATLHLCSRVADGAAAALITLGHADPSHPYAHSNISGPQTHCSIHISLRPPALTGVQRLAQPL